MDIKIKFLNPNIQEIESRRINIDYNSLDFQQFLSHLKNLFQLNESNSFYIKCSAKNQWILTENDWQLFKAFHSESLESVIKIELYNGHLHINVECDICNNTVSGDRFKCLQCDDFDICQSCFQSHPDIHKDHCMLLLRKPEDSVKYLRSIPCQMNNGSDFRVLDIDLSNLEIGNNRNPNSTVSTETASTQTVSINTDHKSTDFDEKKSVDQQPKECVEMSSEDEFLDSSVSEQYFNSLPKQIHEALGTLRSMGFRNINSTLIALLVANNGNIYNVLEEIEYSKKH